MTTEKDWPEEEVFNAGAIPTEGVTEKDVQPTGSGIAAAGKYHFLITGFTDKNEPGKTSCILLNCTVLEAEYPTDAQKAQIDMVLFHRMYYARKAKGEDGQPEKDADGNSTNRIIPMEVGGQQAKGILTFAMGIGLLTAEDLNGQQTNMDWNAAVGKQFCAQVTGKEETYNKQTRMKFEIPFSAIHPVTDPFVEDWPKNAEYLAIAVGDAGLQEEVSAMAGGSSSDNLGDLADL